MVWCWPDSLESSESLGTWGLWKVRTQGTAPSRVAWGQTWRPGLVRRREQRRAVARRLAWRRRKAAKRNGRAARERATRPMHSGPYRRPMHPGSPCRFASEAGWELHGAAIPARGRSSAAARDGVENRHSCCRGAVASDGCPARRAEATWQLSSRDMYRESSVRTPPAAETARWWTTCGS